MKKPKFKKKYVLGEGYPWALGVEKHKETSMVDRTKGVSPIVLDWPEELWSADVPKYRLVLEKVDDKKSRSLKKTFSSV